MLVAVVAAATMARAVRADMLVAIRIMPMLPMSVSGGERRVELLEAFRHEAAGVRSRYMAVDVCPSTREFQWDVVHARRIL